MTKFKRHEEKGINPDNIWEDDAFQTLEKYADFLSNAMTASVSNFVLNVNGSWGTGKSFFVNRWAEALRQQGHPVVEFNAWENDSAEDPLAPLIAAILDQQKELLPTPMAQKIKDNCGKFLMAGGGLIVRAGLKQLVGDKGVDQVNDLLSGGAENELIKLAGNYVDEQLEKQKASDDLKKALLLFVGEILDSKTKELPIFIFIDELDRCRPTFAIELLERVKHLFHVDGIKFIISTDTEQLVHSISGVYGDRFAGATYLQRFLDETFTLPNPNPHQFSDMLFQDFDPTQSWMNNWHVLKSPSFTFGELAAQLDLTLRQQLQAHHRVMAVVSNTPIPPNSKLHFFFICILVMLRLRHSADYKALMSTPDKAAELQRLSKPYNLDSEIQQVAMEYMQLIDLSHQEIIERVNSYDDSEWMTAGRRRTDAEGLISDMHLSCHNALDIFKKYPQLVELTETIS